MGLAREHRHQLPKQVNVVNTRRGRPLAELVPKKQEGTEISTGKSDEAGNPNLPNDVPMQMPKPPPPFHQKLKKKKEDECFQKFIGLLKQVHINLPLCDILQGIPKYDKYVKDNVANKNKLVDFKIVALMEECSSMILNKTKLLTK